MINIIALKQLYKEKKIDKIRWICGKDNSANVMTKALTNLVLKGIIFINKAIIKLEN